MSTQLPPVNQHEIEKEFYDFIMLPENYGFNAAFARQLGHKEDSTVSNWHSPHVPASKSWLYKAADRLDRCFKARPAVGRKALSILNRVAARHEKPASEKGLDAAFYAFKAALAAFEDNGLPPEKLEEARAELQKAVALVGMPEHVMRQEMEV